VVAVTVVEVPSVVGSGLTLTRTANVLDVVVGLGPTVPVGGVADTWGEDVVPPLGQRMPRTGCNSMAFGATPLCPCGKSKKPTPVTDTARRSRCHTFVGANRAVNARRTTQIAGRKGLTPMHSRAGISAIMV
jgi:hypothetical protein